MKSIFCIGFLIALFSCAGNKIPPDILPPEKMEKLLWEQMRAEVFTKNFIAKDSAKNISQENLLLQQKIFQKYKITAASFYKSYDFYLQHDGMMKDILDSIMAKEQRGREKEIKEKDSLKM